VVRAYLGRRTRHDAARSARPPCGHGAPVVFNVDLEVKEGEIVALLGANGAGKTATAPRCRGYLPLMAGEVSSTAAR
jgi:ABC-type branched-subunit amino acid transport system ATPase component